MINLFDTAGLEVKKDYSIEEDLNKIYTDGGLKNLLQTILVDHNLKFSYSNNPYFIYVRHDYNPEQLLTIQINDLDFQQLSDEIKRLFKDNFIKDTNCQEAHFSYKY